jgi:hypothetical protein
LVLPGERRLLVSELLPNRHRTEGQTLGSSTHWIFAALLTTFFLAMVTKFPTGYVFLFFTGMMVLQLIWVKTMVPETKGVPLEEIQKQLGIAYGDPATHRERYLPDRLSETLLRWRRELALRLPVAHLIPKTE